MKLIENNIEYTKSSWQTKVMSGDEHICWISIERKYQNDIYTWKLDMWFFDEFYREIVKEKCEDILVENILEILKTNACKLTNGILKMYTNCDNVEYLQEAFKDKELIIEYLQKYE